MIGWTVTLLGCSHSVVPDAGTPTVPPVPTPVLVSPQQPFVDGDRLRGVFLTDSDGNRFYVGAYDTERREVCDFVQRDADHWMCVPLLDAGFQPLSLEPECATPRFARLTLPNSYATSRITDPATCSTFHTDAYWVLNDPISTHRWWAGESCEELAVDEPEDFYEVEPVTGLVMATAEVAMFDGVPVRVLRAEDGSQLLEGLVTTEGDSCELPGPGYGAPVTCQPEQLPVRVSHFLDPVCSVPAATATWDCGSRDLAYQTDPTFQVYRLGPEVAAEALYSSVRGECSQAYLGDRTVYEVAEPVEAPELPVVESEFHGAEAQQVWAFGESGMAIAHHHRGDRMGFWWNDDRCQIVLLDNEHALCAPYVYSSSRGGFYADDACTEPALWSDDGPTALVRSDLGAGRHRLPLARLVQAGPQVFGHVFLRDRFGCNEYLGSGDFFHPVPFQGDSVDWPTFDVEGL